LEAELEQELDKDIHKFIIDQIKGNNAHVGAWFYGRTLHRLTIIQYSSL